MVTTCTSLAVPPLNCYAICTEKEKRKHRWWCKELFHRRLQYDNRLMKDMHIKLVDDTIKNFTRLTLDDFDYLPCVTSLSQNWKNWHQHERSNNSKREVGSYAEIPLYRKLIFKPLILIQNFKVYNIWNYSNCMR